MRLSVLAFCLSSSALALAVACPPLAPQGTSDFFQARILPRDRSVNLQLSTKGDAVEWQTTPEGVPVSIKKDELLLTYSSFKVGYLHYNPLTARLEVSVNDFNDPAQLALQKLIDALTSVATTISGAKTDLAAVKKSSVSNYSLRRSNELLSKEQVDPIDLIQHQVDAAVATIGTTRKDIEKWPQIIEVAWGVPGTTGPAVLNTGVAKMEDADRTLGGLVTGLGKAFEASKDASFSTGTEIRLLNRLDTLMAQVAASQKAVEILIATLQEDEKPSRWTAPNQSVFVLGTLVAPTLSTGEEVIVTLTPLKLQAMNDGLTLEEQKPITASFKALRYRALMPEVGVGAVLGYIDRPKYGTALDTNGKTIVALSETDLVSVDPAVMVNFVCHCNAGGIAPMLQIGAATSKDLPALLMGGGFRLFGLGKGDVGIGGGLLLGWYKDLQKLKVGSAVGGTADIDADMGYITTPKPALYMSLQYKF